MARGPAPKSPEDRERDGDTSHRPDRDATGDNVRPQRPGGLSRDSRLAWDRIVDELESVGILDSRDWPIIEAMSVAIGKARTARRAAQKAERDDKTAPYYTTPNGAIARHPALKDEDDAWKTVSQLSDKLGIGPEGRARVGLKRKPGGAGAPQQPRDPFADLPEETEMTGPTHAIQGGAA